MRTVLIATNPDLQGLLPSKLIAIYIPTGKPLPEQGEAVKLVDETTGEILTKAVVDFVDADQRMYDVRVW